MRGLHWPMRGLETLHWPIRGLETLPVPHMLGMSRNSNSQLIACVMLADQWEASIQVTWSVLTNERRGSILVLLPAVCHSINWDIINAAIPPHSSLQLYQLGLCDSARNCFCSKNRTFLSGDLSNMKTTQIKSSLSSLQLMSLFLEPISPCDSLLTFNTCGMTRGLNCRRKHFHLREWASFSLSCFLWVFTDTNAFSCNSRFISCWRCWVEKEIKMLFTFMSRIK